jgi:acetyl-CoA C-acetyltransferase
VDAFIVAAARTAGGRRNGKLSNWHPVDLGAFVIDSLLDRSGLDPAALDDVIAGCVSQAGEQSTNLARNIVLASRLPVRVPGVTVDRQCGSSQQALHFAAQAVMSGVQDVVLACGVESMTRVPMGLPLTLPAQAKIGTGYVSPRIRARFPGPDFSQFVAAQTVADMYGLKRHELDEFALSSHRKAAAATNSGAFAAEIVPVPVTGHSGEATIHVVDEGLRFDASLESIASVKLIAEHGILTAANASQICDGASGVMVANERAVKTHELKPLARIAHMHVIGGDPVTMLDTPIEATRQALAKAGMSLDQIDLYEVNEAFAPIPLAWLKALGASSDKLNVHGGAISLGHPLGASGTKLLTTLVNALHWRRARYGLQTMCEGGGLANVTIVERL